MPEDECIDYAKTMATLPQGLTYGYDELSARVEGTLDSTGERHAYIYVAYTDNTYSVFDIVISVYSADNSEFTRVINATILKDTYSAITLNKPEDFDFVVFAEQTGGVLPEAISFTSVTTLEGCYAVTGTATEAGEFTAYFQFKDNSASNTVVHVRLNITVVSDISDITVDETCTNSFEINKVVDSQSVLGDGTSIVGAFMVSQNLPDGLDYSIDHLKAAIDFSGTPTRQGSFESIFCYQTDDYELHHVKLIINVFDNEIDWPMIKDKYDVLCFAYYDNTTGEELLSVKKIGGEYPKGELWSVVPVAKDGMAQLMGTPTSLGANEIMVKAQFKNAGDIYYKISITVFDDASGFSIDETITRDFFLNDFVNSVMITTPEGMERTVVSVLQDNAPTGALFTFNDQKISLVGVPSKTGAYITVFRVQFRNAPTKYYQVVVSITELLTNTHIVKFVDGVTGAIITTEKIENGKDAVLPIPPTHEGYTFTGWDKDGKNITWDTRITAQYSKDGANTWTVTFVDGITGETITTQQVEDGKDATMPTPPTHEGYTFTGWDNEGKNITEDTTITAQYRAGALLGDVTGDGIVNTGDAVMLLKYAANMIELTEIQQLVGDVTGDGLVNTGDAVAILKYAAGMITLPETWL